MSPGEASMPAPPQGAPTIPTTTSHSTYYFGQAAPQQSHPSPGAHTTHSAASAEAPHSAQSAYYQTPQAQTTATQTMPRSTKQATPRKTFLYGFLGAFLACVLAFSGFGAYSFITTPNQNASSGNNVTLGSSQSSEIQQVSEDATLAEVVAEKTLPSVVSIYIYTTQSSQGFGMFGFESMQDSGGELVQSAMGSGVVLSEDGYVITNYHVVEGAEKIMVSLEGYPEPVEATLVGADESSDIAVIKVEGVSDLTPIEIGDSSDLSVGEWVMALGSPYGLEQSISTGIVSAVSRSYAMESSNGVALYANLIQTDAAINQGNSGGALVDSDGKLIGINTLISSNSGDSSGVGFAIPVDYAMGIAQDLVEGKTPSHAQLGVTLSSVTSSAADRYNLAVSEGAYIDSVSSGSAAEKAGIQNGDIITRFNDTTVASATDLMLAIRAVNPGDTVEVELNRDGEAMTVQVTLGSDAR